MRLIRGAVLETRAGTRGATLSLSPALLPVTLDHLGIAVDSPAAIALFERLLGAAPYKTETVAREGVETTFFGDGGAAGAAPKLEMLTSLAPDSPVGAYLAKRGPGLHHVAFEVADLRAEMDRVRALGLRLLADEPRAGADGKQIVFLHPKDTAGVLVELCQSVRTPPERVDVPFAGTTLAAWVSGPADAPPLVVLHGALGSTALETDRLVRHWERRFRVVGLDFEGHGASGDVAADGAPRVPSWSDFTDNVAATADHLGLNRFALFGFSMGGGVALAFAHAHADRVSRLAVHAVNVKWTDSEVAPMVDPMEPGRLAAETPFWAQRLTQTHGDRWPDLARRMADFTRALPEHRMADDTIREIATPTFVTHGDRDRFFSLDHPIHLRRTLPDARLAVLPGVGHPIQTLDAPAYAALVASFLEA